MKAYSIDLRQKVIDAHNNEEGSQRQLAKREACEFKFCSEPAEAIPMSVAQSKQSRIPEVKKPN